MARFNSLILVLFIAATTFAGTWIASPGAGSHGGAATTYLVNEGFEGAGTPSGWDVSGSPNYDSTTSPLVGAQSLRCTSGSDFAGYNTTALDTVYMKFRFRISTLGTTTFIAYFQTSGFAPLAYIVVLSDGTLNVQSSSGSIYATSVATMSAGTIYDVWFRYTKGTGANAVGRVWFATAGSAKPADGSNNSAGGSSGTETGQFGRLAFSSATSVTCDYDTVQVAITDF